MFDNLTIPSHLLLKVQVIQSSLASQPLFLRGGARGEGREKESGDLSQQFVFSAGMWVEPMRL